MMQRQFSQASHITFQVHSSLKTFSVAARRAVFSSNFINDTIISSSTKIIVLSYMKNEGTIKTSQVVKDVFVERLPVLGSQGPNTSLKEGTLYLFILLLKKWRDQL